MSGGLPVNPFVGLRPFRIEDALLFFGRRLQIAELMDRLNRGHFLALVGSSGCGKSSLVRAGLIPHLKAGFLVGDRDQWIDVAITPGETPLTRLATGFGIAEAELRESGAGAVVEHLQRQPESSQKNCFLLIDQFEELFRFALSGTDREDAEDFVSCLLALSQQRDFPVFVVLTMRSDFLDECDAFHGLPEAFNHGQYLVPRLTRQERREAIESPVRLFSRSITSQLVDHVLNDVGDEPDQLPVMEHALMRTWEAWQAAGSNGPIDLPHYLAVGGAKDALSRDAEAAIQSMTPAEMALTEAVFQALTDTDPSRRKIRRPARFSQLAAIGGVSIVEVQQIVNRFREGGRSFLIVQPVPNSTDALVDISHESLIRHWAKLRSWVESEDESKRIYLDLVDAVQGQKALLRDPDLRIALDWREKKKPTAAWARRYDDRFVPAMEFLNASREAARREGEERRRLEQLPRLRLAAIVFFGLTLIAVAAASWGFYAQGQAKTANEDLRKANGLLQVQTQKASTAEAEANRLRALAENGERYAKAAASREMQLRANAVQLAETEERLKIEADQAAAAAKRLQAQADQAAATEKRLRANADEAAKREAELSKAASAEARSANIARQDAESQRNKDAAALAVQDAGNYVENGEKARALARLARALFLDKDSVGARSFIFDLLLRGGFRPAAAPYVHTPIQGSKPFLHAAFNADGRLIVTASRENDAEIWNAGTSQPVGSPLHHDGLVNFAAFGPNRLVVTASWDKTAKVWDLSGARLRTLQHERPVTSAAFSQDGRVVTSSWDNTAKIWYPDGRSPLILKHQKPLTFAAFRHDGRRVVTASWDNTAQVWNADTGAPIGPPMRHQAVVNSAVFSPDGKLVVTSCADNTGRFWDAVSGLPVGNTLYHSKAVNYAEFSPDGKRVVTASDDYTARVWEAVSGTPAGAPLRHAARVNSAAFSPDGRRVVTASDDLTARIWDVWLEIQNASDAQLLAKLAEAVSGYDAGQSPPVKAQDQPKRLQDVRDLASRPPANGGITASLVRWYFSTPE